jgi:two-component system NtrC family sensor kinase
VSLCNPEPSSDPGSPGHLHGELLRNPLLRAISEICPIPLLVARPGSAEILYCNSRLADLVGLGKDALLGRSILDVCRDQAGGCLRAALERSSTGERDVAFTTESGTPTCARLSLEPIVVSGETLLLGLVYLRDAQRKLLETERMARLGLLMASVAHEVRTPLGALHSAQCTIAHGLDRLVERLAETSPDALSDSKTKRLLTALGESVRVVASGASRVTGIVQRLHRFSCADPAKPCHVDLNEMVRDTLALVHHELVPNVRVETRFGDNVTLVGYPGRLSQVLVNLIVNAAHAVRAQGTGTITLSTSTNADQIEIVISDDGVGIVPEHLGQIFTCGFTTKQSQGGSGLGLAISKEIIEAHKGSLEASSQVGVGTRFTVRLPRTSLDRPCP